MVFSSLTTLRYWSSQIDEDVELAEIAVHPPPPLHVHFQLPDAPVDRHLHLGQRRAAHHPVLGQAVPFLEVLDRRHRLVVIAIARGAVGGIEIAGHHQIVADHRQPIVAAARLQRRAGGDHRPAAIGLGPAQFAKLGAHSAVAVGCRLERLHIGGDVLRLLGAVERGAAPISSGAVAFSLSTSAGNTRSFCRSRAYR